jgi:hypothetical protein
MSRIEPGESPVHVEDDDITAADFAACATISGEAPDAPLGIAFVIALRALLGSNLLPDGAMMLSHRVTWHEKPRPGRLVTEVSIKEADAPRTRYQRVVIGYRTARGEDRDHVVITQEQEVLWPVIA